MKIGSLASARPAFYDRNATTLTQEYQNTLAPHGFTVRFTSTIPSGKKAIVEFAYVGIQRQTAATTPGVCAGVVQVNSGGILLRSPYIDTKDNSVVPATTQIIQSANLTVYAGETIQAQSFDSSGGATPGTVYFVLQAKATQFDA